MSNLGRPPSNVGYLGPLGLGGREPSLGTVAEVAEYLHREANRCKRAGGLRAAMRRARDALWEIARRQG